MEDNWKQFHRQLIWPMTSSHFYGNAWMAVWAVTHSRMEKWRHWVSRGELMFISLLFWEPPLKLLRPPRALSSDLLSSAVSCYRQWRHERLLQGQFLSLTLFGYSYKLHLDLLKHCVVHNIYYKWLFLCVEPTHNWQRVIMSCHDLA